MSDLYNDPNFRRDIQRELPPGSMWVSLAALAAVVVMFVIIGMFAGSPDQTATNAPAVETTGSGSSAPSALPIGKRQ